MGPDCHFMYPYEGRQMKISQKHPPPNPAARRTTWRRKRLPWFSHKTRSASRQQKLEERSKDQILWQPSRWMQLCWHICWCFKPRICGNSLQQPQETNTGSTWITPTWEQLPLRKEQCKREAFSLFRMCHFHLEKYFHFLNGCSQQL